VVSIIGAILSASVLAFVLPNEAFANRLDLGSNTGQAPHVGQDISQPGQVLAKVATGAAALRKRCS
jgi:hypothetical protein